MAEPEAVQDAPEQPDIAMRSTVENTVDLRIVSPSWEAVDIPVFAELPASTSVGQLKERVRNEVTARGRSWQGMRLIYRGRVLDADERTLGNVFGPNMGSGALAVHLVLRDTHGNRSAQQQPPATFTSPSPLPSRDTTSNPPSQPLPADPRRIHQIHQQHMLRAQAVAAATANAHWAQHWAAVNRLQGLPVPTVPAAHTAQMAPAVPAAPVAQTSPTAPTAPTAPAMPGGSTNRVYFSSTVLPTSVPGSQGHSHVHNQATLTHPHDDDSSEEEYIASMYTPMPNTQQNSTAQTSSSAAASRSPDVYILTSPTGPRALLIRDQATTTYFARGTRMSVVDSQNTDGASVAELRNRVYRQNEQILNLERGRDPRNLQARQTGTSGVARAPAGAQQQQQLQDFQEQQRMGQFRLLEQRRMQWQENARLNQQQMQQGNMQQLREMRQRVDRQHRRLQENQLRLLREHNQLLQQQQPHAQGFRRGHLRINNPGAGMVAAMVPHLWLVVRLLLFVWWFTSPNASWTRWTMVILLATAMFVANTGMLNGVANQMWAPVRRHLDGLLPDGNDAAGAGAGSRAGSGAPNQNGTDPNPAQIAARLVGQRRQANATWLMDTIRRAERLGIMFLASLAPGVAERHVALAEQRQAEAARRQREEQEAAVRAAEAAAAAEATATAEAAAEAAAEAGAAATSEATVTAAEPTAVAAE